MYCGNLNETFELLRLCAGGLTAQTWLLLASRSGEHYDNADCLEFGDWLRFIGELQLGLVLMLLAAVLCCAHPSNRPLFSSHRRTTQSQPSIQNHRYAPLHCTTTNEHHHSILVRIIRIPPRPWNGCRCSRSRKQRRSSQCEFRLGFQ